MSNHRLDECLGNSVVAGGGQVHLVKRQRGIAQIDGVPECDVAHATVIREESLRHHRQGTLLVGVPRAQRGTQQVRLRDDELPCF